MAQQGPTGAEMALQWYARANLGTLLWRVHGQCSIDMLSQATLSDCNKIGILAEVHDMPTCAG